MEEGDSILEDTLDEEGLLESGNNTYVTEDVLESSAIAHGWGSLKAENSEEAEAKADLRKKQGLDDSGPEYEVLESSNVDSESKEAERDKKRKKEKKNKENHHVQEQSLRGVNASVASFEDESLSLVDVGASFEDESFSLEEVAKPKMEPALSSPNDNSDLENSESMDSMEEAIPITKKKKKVAKKKKIESSAVDGNSDFDQDDEFMSPSDSEAGQTQKVTTNGEKEGAPRVDDAEAFDDEEVTMSLEDFESGQMKGSSESKSVHQNDEVGANFATPEYENDVSGSDFGYLGEGDESYDVFDKDTAELHEPIDENGPDVEILSVHSSFIISNFDGITAKDVDTSDTGNLQKAYKKFIHHMLGNVCDKAAEHYKHCGGDGDVKPHAVAKIAFDDEQEGGNSWDAVVDEEEQEKKDKAKRKGNKKSTDVDKEGKPESSSSKKTRKTKSPKPFSKDTETTSEILEEPDKEMTSDLGIKDDEDVALDLEISQGNSTTNITLGHQKAAKDAVDILAVMKENETALSNQTEKVAAAFAGKEGKHSVEATLQDWVDNDELSDEEASDMLSNLEESNFTAAPNSTFGNITISVAKEVEEAEEEAQEDEAASNGLLSFMFGQEAKEEEAESDVEESTETEKVEESSESNVAEVDKEYVEEEAASNSLLSFMFGADEEEYDEEEAASNSLLGFMFGTEEAEEEEEKTATKKGTKIDSSRGKEIGSNRRMDESLEPVSGVSVLDAKLYEIKDIACPMDVAVTGKQMRYLNRSSALQSLNPHTRLLCIAL